MYVKDIGRDTKTCLLILQNYISFLNMAKSSSSLVVLKYVL